jgi:hypothetical protein
MMSLRGVENLWKRVGAALKLVEKIRRSVAGLLLEMKDADGG